MLAKLLVVLSLVSLSIQGNGLPKHAQICVSACQECFDEVTFGTTVSTDDYYTGYCEDTLKFYSTFLCARSRCSPYEIKTGIDYIRPPCDDLGIEIPSYDAVIANYSGQSIRSIDYEEITADEIINGTLVPTDEFFDRSYKTWIIYVRIYNADYYYGFAMYGFWSIVLFVGMCNRFFALIMHYKKRRDYEDSEANNERRIPSKPVLSTPRRWIQRYITLPATFGYRHQQPFGYCTIPTRIQSFWVFSFVAINVVLTAVGYEGYSGSIFWTNRSEEIWTYLTDRAGILAVANMPLVWIFAGRNDVFLWLTGWNFGTFNIFHRWVARVLTVQAIIHSIGYTVIYMMEGGRAELAEAYTEQFWYCGVMATIAFSFLSLFAIYPLRKRAYEIFLKLHVSLAIFALVGVFYHIRIYDGEYEPYLWPCVAFWVFDHFVRLTRLVILNYKTAFLGHTKFLVAYSADADIIRITVTPSFHLKPTAGAHYYLYLPTMLKAMGNHPFTMSSWTMAGTRSQRTSIIDQPLSLAHEKDISPAVHTTEAEVNSESNGSMEVVAQSTQIHFVIRPYRGLTARLRDEVLKTGQGSKEYTGFIEGPYGESHPVLDYNTILFIAGGSGISAVLPYMQEFLQSQSAGTKLTKRVHIIWAARQQAFVRDVLDRELASAATNPEVKLDLYVTGASPKMVKDDTVDLDRLHADVGMRYERPEIGTILRKEVAEAVGTVAFLVCGPAGLADDARKAAVQVVGDGFSGLGYFEEAFGW